MGVQASTHQPSQNSVAEAREHEQGKGKDAMRESWLLLVVIASNVIISLWRGRNATISGDLTVGYATSKSDNETWSGSNVWRCLETE